MNLSFLLLIYFNISLSVVIGSWNVKDNRLGLKFEDDVVSKIKITYKGSDEDINAAIKGASDVLKNKKFYDEIKKHKNFDYTVVSPSDISEYIKNSDASLRIRLYKPNDERSNTTAYVTSKYKNTIFINYYKKDRGLKHVVNTIIHEIVHSVDALQNDIKFGHGGNSSVGKDNSAPYWIGDLASKINSGNAKYIDQNKNADPNVPVFEEYDTMEDTIVD
jgi:hypothetical protein